ncbi:MAG: hypothetical protein ACRC8J_07410 [Phocaeicola sp.]
MENVQLLLIIGMIVFSIFRFLNKKTKDTFIPPIVEDEYLDTNLDKEAMLSFEEVEKKVIPNFKKNNTWKNKVKENGSEKQPIPSYHENHPAKNSTHSISLNKRSEAKRAFIYSEIFKKKY